MKYYYILFKQLYIDFAMWIFYTCLSSNVPFRYGSILRLFILRKFFNSIGQGSNISKGCNILQPSGISVGTSVNIARNVTLDGRGGLEIGDNTLIGFESVILTCTHKFDRKDIPIKEQGMFYAPVIIGKDVWIGARVMILPGIRIGDGVIVGANAVITKDIKSNTVVGGVPAKFIHNR